jgi:predicted small lipoprotein YifL
MRFVIRFMFGAIVAALTLCAGAALTGCGNRGGLYMPVVPPVPAKPVFDDDNTTPGASSPVAQPQPQPPSQPNPGQAQGAARVGHAAVDQ